MKIEININYAETLSKSDNSQEMYLKTWTDMGALNIPFNKLVQLAPYNELFKIPGVLRATARYFRGKNESDLSRAEREIYWNIPPEFQEEFHDWIGAAVITEALREKFKDKYDTFYKFFKEKSVEAILSEIHSQLFLYRTLKREIDEGKLIKQKPSYKFYIEKALTFFPDGIKLLNEVSDV